MPRIMMFDICKIYPIWLPPVEDDIGTKLSISLSELGKSIAKVGVTFEEAASNLATFTKECADERI